MPADCKVKYQVRKNGKFVAQFVTKYEAIDYIKGKGGDVIDMATGKKLEVQTQ